MLGETVSSTSVVMQSRTRAVSIWLARSRVTASCLMKAMMGKGCVTIHSAIGGKVLFSFHWSGPLVVVEGDGLESPHRFHDVKSAVTFFDAVLLSRATGLTDAHSPVFDLSEFGMP